jgi:type VI secretion system protein VasD
MQTRSWKGFAAGVFLSVVLVVAGCGSDEPEPLPSPPPPPPPPPPTRIEGRLVAASDVNPDIDGNPAPVVVRLYELRAETAFGNADFFQLHDDDTAVLGGDMVARSEYILLPGETVTVSKTLPANVRFLGATAAYQAIEGASWRALMPVPSNQTTTLTVSASRLRLSFENVSSIDPLEAEKKDHKK